VARNSDNRKRAFADVVAIDAWHQDFDGDGPKVDLHADVVFGTARVGGEQEAPVRFRLSVKRAEIVVVIPETEPATVDIASVSREAPELHGQITEIVEKQTHASAKAGLTGTMASSGPSVSAELGASAQGSIASSSKVEITGTVRFMTVTQSKNSEGYYRWIVQSRNGEPLMGRPWNGAEKPRLKLIDQRKDKTKGIPPTVRVEVRCRREDLIIEDLELKEESLWQSLSSKRGHRNRMVAAESYIRDRLVEEGLDVRNIEDVFGQLTLGSATAETS
jgi:hypothetical protein